ncbi:hypothetical protein ACOMHN_053867 [Nucella lapillus]
MAAVAWRAIPCSRRQLRLDVVLQCGQSFRWRENDSGEWLGVLSGRVWRLKQNNTHVFYQVYNRDTSLPQNKTETEFLQEKDSKRHHVTDTQTQSTQAQQHTQPEAKHRTKPSTRKSQSLAGDKQLLGQKKKVKIEKADFSTDSSQVSSEDAKVPCVKSEPTDADAVLQDYFQLNVDIDALYQQWSRADPYFKKTASDFWGIRILRQDPVENLFSFICSSNNNISRISSMVGKLCDHYGDPVTEVDGKLYHSFPVVASLARPGVEEKLRELGFGYRAKFIATSAKYIMENSGEGWVSSLRGCLYEEAKTALMKLCGVGAKVADCVCLMSLDKTGAIPVDTHVWQFAARNYLPKLVSAKSVTDKLYLEIGDHFRNLWGQYAGWAHSVLFTAELRHMQSIKTSPEKTPDTEGNPKAKRKSKPAAAGDAGQSVKRAKASKKK